MSGHLFVRFAVTRDTMFSPKNLKLGAMILGAGLLLFLLFDNLVMPWYTQHWSSTTVPDMVGMPVEEAMTALRNAGLDPKESELKPDKRFPAGIVSNQNPPAGAVVKYGRGIYLTVSEGEVMVEVPSLRGKSVRDATFTLERAGLRLGEVRYEPSNEIFMNTVISQSIGPERSVRSGTFVGLVVSQGRPGEKRTVPNVVSRSLQEAERLLIQSGFILGAVTYQPSYDLLPNTVIDQFPKAGESASFGQPVDIFVAQKGEPPTELEN